MSRSRLVLITASMALTLACDTTVSEPDPELEAVRNGLFMPDPFQPEPQDEPVAMGDAVVLAEIALDNGGTLRFIDEDPGAESPAISLVALEPGDSASVMELVGRGEASPLEVFLAVAPDPMQAPLALVHEHEHHHAERGLDRTPRTLSLTAGPRATGAWPEVDDDPWGPNCSDAGAWAWGFNLWSLLGTDGRFHSGIVTLDAFVDQYGYFGTYDHVWAGVCIHEYGVSPTTVSMQRWDGAAYVVIAGTHQWVPRKDRYRYYSYSPGTAARRLRIHATGGGGITENKLMVSAAWVEGNVEP